MCDNWDETACGQTAIYGLSSVLGRMVNFLLVPLQTAVLSQSEYGINIDFYSLIAFLIVVATFGMETAYFRFSEKKDWDESKVFGTSVTMILLVLTGLALLTYTFKGTALQALRYEESPEFLFYLFVILSLDALAAIPLQDSEDKTKSSNSPESNWHSSFQMSLSIYISFYLLYGSSTEQTLGLHILLEVLSIFLSQICGRLYSCLLF